MVSDNYVILWVQKIIYTTTFVANCGHPASFLWKISNDSFLNIDHESYDGLPIEGKILRLVCPPGLELNGPNSAICTEKAQWDFDSNMPTCVKKLGNNSVMY